MKLSEEEMKAIAYIQAKLSKSYTDIEITLDKIDVEYLIILIDKYRRELNKKDTRVHCYNMKCKYCDVDYICTNKEVELNFVGINTKYQDYKELLECTKYEPSELYIKTIELLDKIKKDEKDE